MRRRGDEVNGSRRLIAHRMRLVALVATLALTFVLACGGPERNADRLWRRAMDRVQHGDTSGAITLMQTIIDTYPDTDAAAKARDQIVVYRGLAHAVESYPMRRARALMVQVGRAVEAYKHEKGHLPATLADLVPRELASIPDDPWGRPFAYVVTGRSYRLRCDGADGAVGGTGEAGDLLVVDGHFVAAR
jgi:hypothetical protein